MQLALQARHGYRTVKRSAQWAEANGLVAFGVPDHYMEGSRPETPAYDQLTHLAGLALETSRIELVSMVSPITVRHPAVLLKVGVTIDEMSAGRFTLGVGTGWLDKEFALFGLPYPRLSERFEMLEEAMEYLRAATTPGTPPYLGRHYQLADFDPQPQPRNLRLLVGGGGGVKTPHIAGRFADEFNILGSPDVYRERVEAAKTVALSAGRDPESLLFSAAVPALAAIRESDYRELLEEYAGFRGQTLDQVERTCAEMGYPHGSGSQPAEMLAALEEAGCSRLYVQAFSPDVDRNEMVFEAYRL